MDKKFPHPALLRAYSVFANNLQPTQFPNQLHVPLQPQLVAGQVQLPSQPQHPNLSVSAPSTPVHPTPAHPTPAHPTPVHPTPVHPTPVHPTPAPSPETNACEKLSHLTRSIRGRLAYRITRIGGEDHDPLFRADVHITPQKYSAEGVGRSKLIARRNAATNMINYINENFLVRAGDLPNRNLNGHHTSRTTHSPPVPKASPKQEAKVELEEEMEEGELDSDDPGNNDEEQPAFFVDREPDPELEREAQDESTLQQPSCGENVTKAEEAEHSPLHPATQDIKQEDAPAVTTAAVVPAVQPGVTTSQTLEGVSGVKPVEPRQAPKRMRTPPDQELSVASQGAPSSDLWYAIPPRKRTKTITREFPTRLHVSIFCTYTDDVKNCLKALADANLFVDLSITMFSTVELAKYVLIEKNVTAEVTMLSGKQGRNPAALVAKLACAVGANSESLWVARAKHLAHGYPLELSPRILVLHDDPSLEVLAEDRVIEVMPPTDEVAKHLAAVLERAKRPSSTAT